MLVAGHFDGVLSPRPDQGRWQHRQGESQHQPMDRNRVRGIQQRRGLDPAAVRDLADLSQARSAQAQYQESLRTGVLTNRLHGHREFIRTFWSGKRFVVVCKHRFPCHSRTPSRLSARRSPIKLRTSAAPSMVWRATPNTGTRTWGCWTRAEKNGT